MLTKKLPFPVKTGSEVDCSPSSGCPSSCFCSQISDMLLSPFLLLDKKYPSGHSPMPAVMPSVFACGRLYLAQWVSIAIAFLLLCLGHEVLYKPLSIQGSAGWPHGMTSRYVAFAGFYCFLGFCCDFNGLHFQRSFSSHPRYALLNYLILITWVLCPSHGHHSSPCPMW